MNDWRESLSFVPRFLLSDDGVRLLRAALWIALGLPTLKWLSRMLQRFYDRRYSQQLGMIVGKLVFYGGLGAVCVSVLMEFDFKLGPLLGAAGVVGVAVGFASQTSLSNVISGLFLIAEKPFVVGDVVTVDGVTGSVLSIDLLSLKLRTFDNQFVRIPNEAIIKGQVRNITRFPIRRMDTTISVAYKEDLGRVREILLEVAAANPLCLQDPAPLIVFNGYGASGIELLFAVWAAREDFLELKNGIFEQVKRRFDDAGIEIPFPHLSVYTGEATRPFPVELRRGGTEKPAPRAAK